MSSSVSWRFEILTSFYSPRYRRTILNGWVRVVVIILFFFILFLIGFGFSLLTHITHIQQFLLRSLKSRVAGLLLLAMFSFLTVLLFTSRLLAGSWFSYLDSAFNNPMYAPYLSINWDWAFQNKPSIINELWIQSLIPTLSEETCFSSDPLVCNFAGVGDSGWWEGHIPWNLVAAAYTLALIPAFITFVLGWLFIRKRRILVAS